MTSVSGKLVCIAAGSGLGLVMLALALALLKFFRHQNINVCVSPGVNLKSFLSSESDSSSKRQ